MIPRVLLDAEAPTFTMADSASQTATGYDHHNLRHVVITSTCFAFILSTVAVGFRVISRKLNGTGLYLDDFLMIGALVSFNPNFFSFSVTDQTRFSNMGFLSLELFVGFTQSVLNYVHGSQY